MFKLSDKTNRKFIESFDVSEWEVETEDGFKSIISTNKTIEYRVYKLKFDNGLELKCADTHILIDENYNEVYAINSIKCNIRTKLGISSVVTIEDLEYSENMYDLSVDSEYHTFYTNDILSHNTQTSAAYILWYTNFNSAKTAAILANKASAAREVMSRYQLMFESLPDWLQQGVTTWNKGDVELENKSKVFTSATSASGIRGKSVNLLYVDEAAFIQNTVAEQFFTSVYPTISAGKTTKILLSSTPLGYNHFWKFWSDAEKGANDFVPLFIPYTDIPGRDAAWAEEQRRQLGDLKFAQEVECSFLGSSLTLIPPENLSKLTPTNPIVMKDGLDVFESPIRGRTYVMTVDVAKGTGGDFSTINVIDISELPYIQVAKYKNNKIAPLLFPNIIYKIAKEYNNAYVLIEINISEQVAHILHYELEYENMLLINKTQKGLNKGQIVGGGFGSKPQLGVQTDKKVKRVGCANLKSLIVENRLIINDVDTIAELSTFIEVRDSFEADDGYHDDLVMGLVIFSWLTGQQFFKELNNVNLRRIMYANQMMAIEEEMTPFGFYDDGNEAEELPLFNF